MHARANCLQLLVHWARRAASRAACTAGRSSAISTAMIAITTRSSIRVKPRELGRPPLHEFAMRGTLLEEEEEMQKKAGRGAGTRRLVKERQCSARTLPGLP